MQTSAAFITPYEAFSDASTKGRTAIAVRVLSPNGTMVEHAEAFGFRNTLAGELRGYVMALSLTPIGAHVILHYDISDLPKMIERTSSVSYASNTSAELKMLRQEIAARVVTFRRVQNLSVFQRKHYCACHKVANRAAGTA